VHFYSSIWRTGSYQFRNEFEDVKILHAGSLGRPVVGIIRQLQMESRAARELAKGKNIQWDVLYFAPIPSALAGSELLFLKQFPESKLVSINMLRARANLFRLLRQQINEYDYVLLRWPAGDPLLWLYRDIFRDVYTIHHAREIDEFKSSGLTGRLRAILERAMGNVLLSKVKGIIGVTPEIASYEIERINAFKNSFIFPNGVDYDMVPMLKRTPSPLVTFFMSASYFSPWHGLDLAVAHLQQRADSFVFHIVGTVPQYIVRMIAGDSRFILHGFKSPQEIMSIMAGSDVGLSSLALFRKGMEQACPLKVREYLAAGLPVISGHADSALPLDFPYYRQISIQEIDLLNQALEMRKYSPDEIRSSAREHIEKVRIMERLAEEMCK
jgi:glycosyltransferase involved in cell wall biosynthesis